MVNKLIRRRKIEIILVALFVIISIPLWQYLEKELNTRLTNALQEETRLELAFNRAGGYDNVIINNAYTIDKKYQLLLITEENCNDLVITMNNNEYVLANFFQENGKEGYIYTLATDDIKGSRKGYKITLNLENKDISYYYKLEELIYF